MLMILSAEKMRQLVLGGQGVAELLPLDPLEGIKVADD